MTTNQGDRGFKFTGGDNLTGINQIYHEVMMRNELEGGYGAYKVSYAGEKSGFSFGGNQMDMKKNSGRSDIFRDILTQAKDNAGIPILTKNEIKLVAGDQNQNLIKSGQSLESVFGEMLSRVNAALSSKYGRTKIDEVYPAEIKNGADHIEKSIENMKNPGAKKFYDSNLGRALLFDYHNQFNLGLKDRLLRDYIDGKGKEDYTTKKNLIAPVEEYTLEHHLQFIRGTKQFYKRPDSCIGRIEKVLKVIEEFSDFAFTFDQKEHRWKIFPGLVMPEIPPPEGRQRFFI